MLRFLGSIIVIVLVSGFYNIYQFADKPNDNRPSSFSLDSISPVTPQEAILLGQKLDINVASVADLEVIPGIGPSLAKRIVEYRNAHGPFRSIEELDPVNGVGPKILERLKIYLKL
ncbi:MAG: hypothetical protein COV46_00260 [Deltaproteobacteria bacterium CG11_big_fil_rev_8_21_14_0_20_49_13]|nr:MAG: hypothetical protein COV46_00260 [Deltaproteobacteria bacterium CG11_big_fil_rev_8_21_14_0_20_49_13]